MKNDEVLYHQVSSFFPEGRTKEVLQERAVEGGVYCLPWRYNVVQYYPVNVIHDNERHHRTFCRVHFPWTRRIGMFPFIRLEVHLWFV